MAAKSSQTILQKIISMYDALKERYGQPSRIPDPLPSSKYTTTKSDSRSIRTSFIERPVSTIQRVIEKVSAMSGLNSGIESPFALESGKSSGANSDNGRVKDDNDDEFHSCFVIAKKLQNKLNRIKKYETNLAKLETEFQADLLEWGYHMTDELSSVILTEMAKVLSTQRKAEHHLMNRKQEIQQMLSNVAEKEKLKKKYFDDRVKLKNSQKEIINNYGINSTKAEKINEDLESNYCNLQVLEAHYTKAITHGLKDSFQDYSLTLQSISANLENRARMFNELVKAAELDASKSRNSPSKYLQLNENANDDESLRLSENLSKPNVSVPICAPCSEEVGLSIGCRQPKYHHKRIATNEARKHYPPSASRLEGDTLSLNGLNLGNFHSNESWT